MVANMATFMSKDIPDFLKGRPLYFIRSCMNRFQDAVEQFHQDMIKERYYFCYPAHSNTIK